MHNSTVCNRVETKQRRARSEKNLAEILTVLSRTVQGAMLVRESVGKDWGPMRGNVLIMIVDRKTPSEKKSNSRGACKIHPRV